MSDSLQPHGLYSPWNSLGQNTAVGSLSFLQGIFPTQGLNLGLWHSRQVLYQLSHKGNPRILEWIAYPFSSNSFRPSNWTEVSCIAGEFFTNWAIREAPPTPKKKQTTEKWTQKKKKERKKAKQRGAQEQNQGWGTAEWEDSVIKLRKQPKISNKAERSSKSKFKSRL